MSENQSKQENISNGGELTLNIDKFQLLQRVLNSGAFQKSVIAHRMIDRQRHGFNIYEKFPDFSPPQKILEEMHVQGEGNDFLLEKSQLQILEQQVLNSRTLVKSAWLFTAVEDPDRRISFIGGHAMKNVKSKAELDALMENPDSFKIHQTGKYIKGMFIKMGGYNEGTYVLQLDGGDSRNLWDGTGDKQELVDRMVTNLLSEHVGRYWVDRVDLNGVLNPILIISSADFKIEFASKIKSN